MCFLGEMIDRQWYSLFMEYLIQLMILDNLINCSNSANFLDSLTQAK